MTVDFPQVNYFNVRRQYQEMRLFFFEQMKKFLSRSKDKGDQKIES